MNTQLTLPDAFAKTIHSFFPKLGFNLSQIIDPRMKNKITYDANLLLWSVIFIFFLNLVLQDV